MANSRRGTTTDTICKAIRTDIRKGVFPPGVKLTTAALATRYQVSRTPVREALIRLEQEKLLRGTANAGYEIPQLTIRELCEIYEVREALEGVAIERMIRNGPPPELIAELERFCELGRNGNSDTEQCAGDLAFHQAICRNCGSETLRDIVDNFLILTTIFATTPRLLAADRTRDFSEHEAILAAVRNGRAKVARTLLTNHIASARKRLEKLIR